ncbi:MAG: hypothetical protein ACXV3D_03895 [Halobacteriota archaeon]
MSCNTLAAEDIKPSDNDGPSYTLNVVRRSGYNKPAFTEASSNSYEGRPTDDWLYERLRRAGRFMDN